MEIPYHIPLLDTPSLPYLSYCLRLFSVKDKSVAFRFTGHKQVIHKYEYMIHINDTLLHLNLFCLKFNSSKKITKVPKNCYFCGSNVCLQMCVSH